MTRCSLTPRYRKTNVITPVEDYLLMSTDQCEPAEKVVLLKYEAQTGTYYVSRTVK